MEVEVAVRKLLRDSYCWAAPDSGPFERWFSAVEIPAEASKLTPQQAERLADWAVTPLLCKYPPDLYDLGERSAEIQTWNETPTVVVKAEFRAK